MVAIAQTRYFFTDKIFRTLASLFGEVVFVRIPFKPFGAIATIAEGVVGIRAVSVRRAGIARLIHFRILALLAPHYPVEQNAGLVDRWI